jgi:hypothetical protein
MGTITKFSQEWATRGTEVGGWLNQGDDGEVLVLDRRLYSCSGLTRPDHPR